MKKFLSSETKRVPTEQNFPSVKSSRDKWQNYMNEYNVKTTVTMENLKANHKRKEKYFIILKRPVFNPMTSRMIMS